MFNPMENVNYVVPKGCVDYSAESYDQLNFYKKTLENIFIMNGGVPLETPVFENTKVLMGKYGEEAETKLVFNLLD